MGNLVGLGDKWFVFSEGKLKVYVTGLLERRDILPGRARGQQIVT